MAAICRIHLQRGHFAVVVRDGQRPARVDLFDQGQGDGQIGERRIEGRDRGAVVGDGGAVGADRREIPAREAADAGDAELLRRRGRHLLDAEIAAAVVLQSQVFVEIAGEGQRSLRYRVGERVEDVAAGGRVDLHGEALALIGREADRPARGQIGRRRQSDGQPGTRVVARQDIAVVAESRGIAGRGWIKPIAGPVAAL